jgi:hypothetical protein
MARIVNSLPLLGLLVATIALPAAAQIIISPPPVILVPPKERPVLVDVEALGRDWGSVWINGQERITFRNFNRRQAVYLPLGAYRVIVTGVTRIDVWDAGYLDVSGDTSILRIRVAKGGRLALINQPQAWFPDESLNWMEVWK